MHVPTDLEGAKLNRYGLRPRFTHFAARIDRPTDVLLEPAAVECELLNTAGGIAHKASGCDERRALEAALALIEG